MSNDFKERLIKERDELKIKFDKLMLFMGSDEFYNIGLVQQTLLGAQYKYMEGYLNILNLRINSL